MDIIAELENIRKNGNLSLLEVEFVRFLTKIEPHANPLVLKAAATCVQAQQNGNVCLDFENWKEAYVFGDEQAGEKITPQLKDEWLTALQTSALVSDGRELTPMVLEGRRLYLHRFWKYEEELAAWLKERAGLKQELPVQSQEIVRELLSPSGDLFEINWQHVAVCLSFLKNLVVISGGPGTGKTFTVLNIIAAQMKAHEADNYRVALAAPTGKAARRLTESIQKGKESLPQAFKALVEVPEDAQTVHKLLGADFRGNIFKYNAENKLPYDLVVIDEASMLDITMWVRLIRAIGPDTKLVVLGDKDQLASVEAGSILGDLCGGSNVFSSEITSRIAHLAGITVPAIEDQPDINDCVIFLTKSYRFSEKSGIYQFAKAVNEADAEKAINILKDEKFRDIKWLPANDNSLRQVISQYAVKHYHEYAGLEVYDRLQISNTKKILCALRVSDWGAQKINHQVEKEIKRTIKQLDFKEWYDGRIVIATKNDSLLKLRNGEIGIFEEMDGERIRFEGDEPIKVSPARLTEYEPAYAITIHKSQGSEFDDVAIILPSIENSILSKEILYTSVTRARQNSLIITKEEILKKTILNSVSRSSGLKQKLWGSLK